MAEIAEAAARELADAAGLDLIDRPIELTDPLRTWMSIGAVDGWLSLEEDMWPDRAGELMGFVRRGYELSEDMTIKQFARRMRYRHRLEDEVAAIFDDVDVLLTPSTAVPAFPAAGPMPIEINGREVPAGMAVPFTMLANLCWNPAISLPAGVNSEGLPVGLQVIARRHRDEVAASARPHLRAGAALAALRARCVVMSDKVPAFLHAFVPPARASPTFISIVWGKGAVVIDDAGKQYVDALGSLWYCQVGHGRDEIVDAITAQSASSPASTPSTVHQRARRCAGRAARRAGAHGRRAGLPHQRRLGVGRHRAEAGPRRARTSRGDKERTLIVSRTPSYHGVSLWRDSSATGLPLNREGYGPLVDEHHAGAVRRPRRRCEL